MEGILVKVKINKKHKFRIKMIKLFLCREFTVDLIHQNLKRKIEFTIIKLLLI
jgi:hypothetical protein